MTEVTQADRKMEPCPWCGKQPVYCPDTSYGEETVFCPDRNECPASPSTYGPVGSGEAITAWNSHRTTAVAEKDARIAELMAENARLREVLWLFREFTLRTATQWQTGANHHHPIYVMIAELVGEMGGITSGPAYRFVQPDNRAALQEIDNAG